MVSEFFEKESAASLRAQPQNRFPTDHHMPSAGSKPAPKQARKLATGAETTADALRSLPIRSETGKQ